MKNLFKNLKEWVKAAADSAKALDPYWVEQTRKKTSNIEL